MLLRSFPREPVDIAADYSFYPPVSKKGTSARLLVLAVGRTGSCDRVESCIAALGFQSADRHDDRVPVSGRALQRGPRMCWRWVGWVTWAGESRPTSQMARSAPVSARATGATGATGPTVAARPAGTLECFEGAV